MTLIDEWKVVLRRAWSMRLAYAAALLQALQLYLPDIQDALPQLQPYLPDKLFALLSGLCMVGVVLARLVHQPEMRK